MQASQITGERLISPAPTPRVLFPYATYGKSPRKWWRYTASSSDFMKYPDSSELLCYTGATLNPLYVKVFLREGTLMAKLPMKYFQNRRSMQLDFTCDGKFIRVTTSELFHLPAGLAVNLEIIRYSAKQLPPSSNLKSIKEWINGGL